MISLTLKKAAGIAFGVMALAMTAPAQQSQVATKFNVPFSFIAGNDVLPAGTYKVWLGNGQTYVDLQFARDARIHRILLTPELVSRHQRNQAVSTSRTLSWSRLQRSPSVRA